MSTGSWRYFAAILVCWLCYFLVGIAVGYPSTALPDIASGRYGFTLGGAGAWFASLPGIGNIFGGFGVAPLMDRWGRKLTFLVLAVITTISWLLLIVANGPIYLFAGRILIGIANGGQMVIVSVYVSELAPKEIRGNSASGNFAVLLLGIAMSYVLGTFINWRWLAVVVVGSSLLVILLGVLFLPETPRWLLVNGYDDLARDNLIKLRSLPSSSSEKGILEDELLEMRHNIEVMNSVTFFGALRILIRKPLNRPFIICQILMVFQQLSATGYIKSYMVRIFQLSLGIENPAEKINQNGGGLMTNPNYQAILIGFCGVIGGLLSIVTTDHLGRRLCLIISSSGVTLSLTCLATYFWIQSVNQQWAVAAIGWLPMASLILYNVSFGIGLGPIPYILMSELFPTRVRGVASSVSFVTHAVFFVLVVQCFGGLNIEPQISFTVYAVLNILGIAFCYVFVPETKLLSLEGIQDLWAEVSTASRDGDS